MGNAFFHRGDALTSAAAPLVASAQHFRCTSPTRSPITPRRPHHASEGGSSPKESLGSLHVRRKSGGPDQSPKSVVSVVDSKSSMLEVRIGPVPHHFRRPLRPRPLVVPSTSSGTPSPTESDRFLPLSSQAITPSLILQRQDEHKLGTFSAINIILGKAIGVGVYSVPSSIFSDVGSVGMTLLLWVLGSFISFCGLAVYLDLGSALPRSGGERVYLERIFRRPRMLATCMFMSYVVLLGFSTPNCVVLGEYFAYALGIKPTTWLIRTIAVITITVACGMHARFPKLGVLAINVLGVAKMIILAFVVLAGIVAGIGSSRSSSSDGNVSMTIAQRNFSNIWANSSSSPYDYSTALLKILYCFRGYNTVNTVLSSVRRPIHTLKVAAPVALTIVSASYLFANIAYFCAVEKEDFREAGVVLAGRFLSNIFGVTIGERVLPWLVIISAFGNVAATSFAQACVNQELGKDGLLPYSDFWAGKTTFPLDRLGTYSILQPLMAKTPPQISITPKPELNLPKLSSVASGSYSLGPALFLHFLISTLVIVLPPPGQIYTFLIEIGGYPVSIISVAVSGGLLYLYYTSNKAASVSATTNTQQQGSRTAAPSTKYISPIPAPKWCVILFFLSNLLVCILPWIPPSASSASSTSANEIETSTCMSNDNNNDTSSSSSSVAAVASRFPYYAYPATGLGILALGVVYWVYWQHLSSSSKEGMWLKAHALKLWNGNGEGGRGRNGETLALRHIGGGGGESALDPGFFDIGDSDEEGEEEEQDDDATESENEESRALLL